MICSDFSTPISKIFQKGGIFLEITGIICEYNPLHLGHKKQIDMIRTEKGADSGIVCAMSGNFVQRGHPAVMDKTVRAKAAIACGADLILELPVTAALSSAEGFAGAGVSILSRLCSSLCFGSENADKEKLLQLAEALLSPTFPPALRQQLESGKSFPAARQAALEHMGLDASLLKSPNNILAVEYCKAILSQSSVMKIMPILRQGNYHDTLPDKENPSATAIRLQMQEKAQWQQYIPPEARALFEHTPLHSLKQGEKAILYRLRTMTDDEFERLPYGSEGLWRKFMLSCRTYSTLEEILAATKSKRYTRSRLDRMAMCAFLGLTQSDLQAEIPYVRVLAFNDRGRDILATARKQEFFFNLGQRMNQPYEGLEHRCSSLYGLFAEAPEAPNSEENARISYEK